MREIGKTLARPSKLCLFLGAILLVAGPFERAFGSPGDKPVVELQVEANFVSLEKTTGNKLTDDEKMQMLRSVGEILGARLGALSSGPPSFTFFGSDKFALRVPGATAGAVRIVVETRGELSFHLVDRAGTAAIRQFMASGASVISGTGQVADAASIPAFPRESTIHGVYDRDENGIKRLEGVTAVKEPEIINGASVESVSVGRDQASGRPTVELILSPEGGDAFLKSTSEHVGEPIVLLLDGEARAAAAIKEPSRDRVSITGFTEQEAFGLVVVLKTQPLPVPLTVTQETN